MPKTYQGFSDDLDSAFRRLDRALLVGTITLPEYTRLYSKIEDWLTAHGVHQPPPPHADSN